MAREPSFPLGSCLGGFWVTFEGTGSRPHQGKEHPLFTKTLDQEPLKEAKSWWPEVWLVCEEPMGFSNGGYTQKDISNKRILGTQEGSNFLIPTLSFKILPSPGIQKINRYTAPQLGEWFSQTWKPQHLLLNHTSWRDTEVDCTEKKKEIPTLTCFYFFPW